MNFDIIAISKARINENINKTSNINFNNFAFEFIIGSSAGGTLIYVANHFSLRQKSLGILLVTPLIILNMIVVISIKRISYQIYQLAIKMMLTTLFKVSLIE